MGIASRAERAYEAMVLVLTVVAALMAFFPEGLTFPGVAAEMPSPPEVMAAALFALMFVVYGAWGSSA